MRALYSGLVFPKTNFTENIRLSAMCTRLVYFLRIGFVLPCHKLFTELRIVNTTHSLFNYQFVSSKIEFKTA